jgi:hypothetical protein
MYSIKYSAVLILCQWNLKFQLSTDLLRRRLYTRYFYPLVLSNQIFLQTNEKKILVNRCSSIESKDWTSDIEFDNNPKEINILYLTICSGTKKEKNKSTL